MIDRFELQKLCDLPIEGVAERLGLQVSRHKCLCPFHDDHHASLSFCTKRNMFRCFVCGASGGTIDLVMRHQNLSFKDACCWLADGAAFVITSYRHNDITTKDRQPFDASRYARFFEHPWLSPEACHFLFDERRLDPRVVRWCRLTSWRDKEGIPWLQTPYYDRDFRLIGIQNRNLEQTFPRFRFPQGSECGIYNLPVLNMLKPGDSLYIAEGCSDCWSLLSAGHKAIAIPSATLLSKKDKDLLVTLNSSPIRGRQGGGFSFHMFPDNDLPGERLFLQLREVLPTLERHQLPQGCKDFSDYYLTHLVHKTA